MCNNKDEDYDHVDAGNQERTELGKKLYSIPTLGLTFANSFWFFFLLFQVLNCFNYQRWGLYRTTPEFPKPPNFGTLMHLHL